MAGSIGSLKREKCCFVVSGRRANLLDINCVGLNFTTMRGTSTLGWMYLQFQHHGQSISAGFFGSVPRLSWRT